ncbi:MAG: helix-hairpin-helix domain-containing protein [Prevotella sp.]|nr:helix-hairpin-helix domain-containing protein [Prevotella sp.]
MKNRLLLILFLFPLSLAAQQTTDWQDYLQRVATFDDTDAETMERTYDALTELQQSPIDINHATREDLERLVFLSDQQIEDLCAYLYHYAPLKSLGELAMVESLDPERRQLLQQFVYVADEPATRHFPSLHNILKYGRNDLMLTAKIPFYKRQGDDDGYLGYPYRHDLRYTFSYGNYVKAGFVGAQDAGEPFFANRNKGGYDHYSFFLLLRQMGSLKTLALGHYRLNFGMGLVMNTDFQLGKQTTMMSLSRNRQALRAHSSRTEADYLQGAAATVRLTDALDITLFASCRPIDATLTADSTAIATIVTTGYHRTQSEMDKKHNSTQTTTGGNISFRQNGWHIGATALYSRLDKPLQPNTNTLYRRYYARGNNFWNVSTDYGYTSRRITFSGETATGDCHALATINSLSIRLNEQLTAIALQRFYSYQYYALYARSFSDGGHVQNESGIYASLVWQPTRQLLLSAYTDYAYAPWARYGISKPSHAWDYCLSAAYTQGSFAIDARYRLRRRQHDNDDNTALITYNEHRARLTLAWQTATLSLHTQADAALRQGRHGWMVSQRAQTAIGSRLKLHASLAYFNTDDYDTRLYLYERGMTYSFSFPAFYGQGIRYAAMAQAAISSGLTLNARIATTNYFDRPTIGTGLQQIDRSSATDLEVQLRWKF